MKHNTDAMQITSYNNKSLNRKRVRDYIGLLYIAPWIIGFLIFQLYPFVASFIYSFTDFTMLNVPSFTGFKNYIDIFTNDYDFLKSMKATLIYVILAVPFKLVFALFIAVILNSRIKFINIFRTVYYIPSILGGSVAVALVWRLMFMKKGMINGILSYLHLPEPDWLGSPSFAMITISLLIVWQFGSSMVIFLAGLKQIPTELYEAGRVDGASRIKMFFKITLPLITPMIFFNLVMQMINAFQDFTSAFIITNGGPMKATYLYGMKLYMDGFYYFKMGYACALSWILFLVILFMTLVIFRSANSWVYYEDGGKSK